LNRSKSTIYFLLAVIVVALASTMILLNMSRIIPDYTRELFSYSNIYRSRNTQDISVMSIIMNYILESDENVNIVRNLEEYVGSGMIQNLINYAFINSREDQGNIRTATVLTDTVFGDLVFLEHGMTTVVRADSRENSRGWFSLVFSTDHRRIYYSMNLTTFVTYEVVVKDRAEKGAAEIIEEVVGILEYLGVTDYFEFEPESIWLLEGSTYIVTDSANNIEVHYDVHMERMIRLVIGFDI